jgi:uncharacterized membrane protein
MGALIWSLIAFIGMHFLLSHPLRAPLVNAVGDKAFQGLYTLTALGTFYWVYQAFRAAPRGPDVWPVGDVIWAIATCVMLFGSILFVGSFLGNPAMATPGADRSARQPARGVFAIPRHPMMWGFALWGAVHGLVAPYPASLTLTAGIIFLALGGSWGQDRKKTVLMGPSWNDWRGRTSFLPFGLQLSGRERWMTVWPRRTPLLGGVALWLLASYLHPLLGGPMAGLWRWL